MRNLMKLVALATLVVTLLGLSKTPEVMAQRPVVYPACGGLPSRSNVYPAGVGLPSGSNVYPAGVSLPSRSVGNSCVTAGVRVPSLGITMSYDRNQGANVLSVYRLQLLGNTVLEVGDVILAIGGVNVYPGVNLDTLMARANVTGRRYMHILDRNTNTIVVLTWCR